MARACVGVHAGYARSQSPSSMAAARWPGAILRDLCVTNPSARDTIAGVRGRQSALSEGDQYAGGR
jgi:hypothetical protein